MRPAFPVTRLRLSAVFSLCAVVHSLPTHRTHTLDSGRVSLSIRFTNTHLHPACICSGKRFTLRSLVHGLPFGPPRRGTFVFVPPVPERSPVTVCTRVCDGVCVC